MSAASLYLYLINFTGFPAFPPSNSPVQIMMGLNAHHHKNRV
uniref:Uncharacterized protein n=1 Tax=Rhizophora mucronata TaxID=61149 RepID=A0A2P2PGE0_RHIMU